MGFEKTMNQRKALARVLFLPIVGSLAITGCDKGNPTEPERPIDYSKVQVIIYSQHVQPLLTNKCAGSGCHNSFDAAGDLVLESWGSIMRGSEHGAMVIPFRAEKSHLIFHVNSDTTLAPSATPRMPPLIPLDLEEVRFLIRWVNEGARNDDGDVPFSNPRSGKVYVTSQADDEVNVIDIESNLMMRMVTVGSQDNRTTPPEAPHNIAIDPQREYYYVNLITGNEIWKYRVQNDSFVAKLNLGSLRSPAQVVMTPDGRKAYVSNFDPSGTHRGVQVFNTQTMTVTKEITDTRIIACHGVQLTHDGRYLWTANQLSDNMAVIDVANDSVIAIVKVDPSVPDIPSGPNQFGPYQLVFSPDDRYAYVTCTKSDQVRVVDTQTRQLVKTISVGANPLILDSTPDGRFVYVANRGRGGSPSTSVSVIRTSDNTELLKIQGVGVEPHGVAVSRDGKYVYVSCENISNPDPPHHPVAGLKTPGYLLVVEVASNQIVKRIEIGAFGAGVAVVQ